MRQRDLDKGMDTIMVGNRDTVVENSHVILVADERVFETTLLRMHTVFRVDRDFKPPRDENGQLLYAHICTVDNAFLLQAVCVDSTVKYRWVKKEDFALPARRTIDKTYVVDGIDECCLRLCKNEVFYSLS